MKKYVGLLLGSILVILLSAFLGGTLLWILYPHIHALFPSAVANNIIAKDLSWWDSVCIVWIVALFKTSTTTKSE